MAAFEFRGIDKAGKEIKGVRDAENEKALRAALKRDGIFLTSVGKGKAEGQGLLSAEVDIGGFFERVKPIDVSIFTRQLATLVKAGIPLVESIGAAVDQVEKPKFRKILGKIKQDVTEGQSLAQAMTAHPEVFTPIFPNMVRAGEASGTLDKVLLRLAEFTEASVKLRQKVRGAMMYPVIMVGVGALILAGMFVYVIPQITQIFQDSGQELPLITRALIGFSDLLRNWSGVGFLGFIAAVFLFRRWKRSPKGSHKWDRAKLKFPVFGSLFLMIGVARFTKTLATLLKSGVPLLTALDITKNVLENQVLVEIIDQARVAVKEGANLADPLKRSGRFPPIVTHMIAIGERSGALEEMLDVVADAYETQVEAKISGLTTLLEPVMIVGMGVTVAIIVFAVLMPILQMNDFIQ
ncbi:MAG: type II secretion system inner membrane protein GspF [Myxococcales bacterium]|nr:type II secretion system inner membrane protein GspF [Myxococcales bacterium]MCB9545383.1 type II secretion system inner membrane protein GspF [Myxococcales bacterium]